MRLAAILFAAFFAAPAWAQFSTAGICSSAGATVQVGVSAQEFLGVAPPTLFAVLFRYGPTRRRTGRSSTESAAGQLAVCPSHMVGQSGRGLCAISRSPRLWQRLGSRKRPEAWASSSNKRFAHQPSLERRPRPKFLVRPAGPAVRIPSQRLERQGLFASSIGPELSAAGCILRVCTHCCPPVFGS
jgi:hypothetical protein